MPGDPGDDPRCPGDDLMAASVAYGGYQPQQYYNTDPGVYEPECDFYDSGQPDYPDTDEFLAQYAGGMTEDGLELPAEQNQGCTLSD